MQRLFQRALLLLASIVVFQITGLRAQESGPTSINIDETAMTRLIPVSLSGFSGEGGAALRFDLEVAGFQIVGAESAQYNISGSSDDHVEGQVVDRITKSVLLANRYNGKSRRDEAHAFADDIILKITGRKGIARTKIAFRGERDGKMELYVADYDGKNPYKITADSSIVAAPSWVPGRRMLFYTSYLSGYPDIYSHDLDTGTRVRVANYPGLNTSAAVSPDGTRIAMVLSKGGSPDIYVCDLNGGNLKQLTKTREDESSPCWSPDGKTICFVSSSEGTPRLYTIPAEGGTMRRVTTVGANRAFEPDWSPDGKWIAFTTQRGNFEICVVPAGGGAATTLAVGEDPSWASNSRTLIFSRRINNKRVLSLLDVPTKRVKDVDYSLGSCSQPSWAK